MIRYTSKAEDSQELKKIEEKDKQFLVEKVIHSVENENPLSIFVEKNPKIIHEIEKTYKICRRVYQLLFVDTADTSIEYIQLLDIDKKQQMDDDVKANGSGVK